MIRIILLVLLLCCSTLHANDLHQKCEQIVDKLLGTNTYDEKRDERIDICIQLNIAAFVNKISSSLVLAIAWHESRFTNVYNNCCCHGAMQIDPRLWCKSYDGSWSPHTADGVLAKCDLNARGAFAARYLSNLYGEGTNRMLCAYAGYKDCNDAGPYINRVNGFRKRIKSITG